MTFIDSFPHLTHRKCVIGSLYVQWSNWFWLDHCKHVNHMKISNDLQMQKATHAGHAYGALTTQDHRATQDDLRAWWLVKGHNGAKLQLWVACWRYACSCIFQCEETRIIFYHTWRTWYLNPTHDDIDIYNIYWCSFQLQIHHQNYLYQYFHGLRKSSLHLQNAAESLDKLLMMACSCPSLISSSDFHRSFYKMQPYYQQNTTIFLFSTLHHSTHPGFRCLHQILRPSSNTQRRRLNIGLRNFLKHLQCLCVAFWWPALFKMKETWERHRNLSRCSPLVLEIWKIQWEHLSKPTSSHQPERSAKVGKLHLQPTQVCCMTISTIELLVIKLVFLLCWGHCHVYHWQWFQWVNHRCRWLP